MRELSVNEIEVVNGGSAAGAAKAAGQALVRIAHPAAVVVGVILIAGGIAAGYMEAHESDD
ncbi:MAG: bacteriocin-like peptide [Thalassotalea sp.]|nr:bacteriocin-like peptide [Thalassotalea sp.]